jgi:hypothetical protein
MQRHGAMLRQRRYWKAAAEHGSDSRDVVVARRTGNLAQNLPGRTLDDPRIDRQDRLGSRIIATPGASLRAKLSGAGGFRVQRANARERFGKTAPVVASESLGKLSLLVRIRIRRKRLNDALGAPFPGGQRTWWTFFLGMPGVHETSRKRVVIGRALDCAPLISVQPTRQSGPPRKRP